MKAILEKIKNRKILVVGDVMLDQYVNGDATRISPEAPVPIVHITDARSVAGGAANVALNIASLGANATVCGITGNDTGGEKLRELLKKSNVRFPAAFRKTGVETIIKTRVVVRNQQLCRLDFEKEPAAYALDSAKIKLALLAEIERADAVIISDYAKGAIDAALIAEIQAAARKKNILVALDPKPRRRIPFSRIDLITPNKSEALELAEMTPESVGKGFPAAAICEKIWKKYRPKNIVITLGADGMLLGREGKISKIIPTFAREVFDVSGAGDTVIASLALALSAGVSFEDAAHFANVAAGIVVGKFGTATVSPDEILRAQN